MKFVVGTSQRLVLVDNGKTRQLCGGHFYGVTHDEEFIYGFHRKGGGVAIDKNLKKVKDFRVPISHCHQAYFDPQKARCLIANTGANSIVTWHPLTEKKGQHRWHHSKSDSHHINSIFRCPDDGRLYVYEHSLKGLKPHLGGVRRLTEDWKGDGFWRIADKGHNVYIKDSWIYVCDSFNSRLVRRKMTEQNCWENEVEELVNTKEYPGFAPRGLAVGEDYILIGLTQLQSRSKRDGLHPGLVVQYDKDYNKIRDFKINNGQIYEVRLVGEVDYAHNKLIWNMTST